MLGCTVGDGLPTIPEGFGSILLGETVVLRCCILDEDQQDALMPDVIGLR